MLRGGVTDSTPAVVPRRQQDHAGLECAAARPRRPLRGVALDAQHEPEPANLHHTGPVGAFALQEGETRMAQLGGSLHQLLFFEDGQGGQARGAGRRVSQEGLGVEGLAFGRRPRVHHLGSSQAGRQRHARRQPLGDAQQVRHDAFVIAREPAPGAAETGVDLVGDQQPALGVAALGAGRGGIPGVERVRRPGPAPAPGAPRPPGRCSRRPPGRRRPDRRSGRSSCAPGAARRRALGNPGARSRRGRRGRGRGRRPRRPPRPAGPWRGARSSARSPRRRIRMIPARPGRGHRPGSARTVPPAAPPSRPAGARRPCRGAGSSSGSGPRPPRGGGRAQRWPRRTRRPGRRSGLPSTSRRWHRTRAPRRWAGEAPDRSRCGSPPGPAVRPGPGSAHREPVREAPAERVDDAMATRF